MIIQKMLFSHFTITAIVMIVLSIFEFDQISYWIIYILSLILYGVSGFISTHSKSKWYNYFIVAIIGIFLWTFCFIKSPYDLNYKNKESGYWFLYQLFIMVSSPLNVINSIQSFLRGNIYLQLFFIFLIPILISLSQYIGGVLKIKMLNKRALTRKDF